MSEAEPTAAPVRVLVVDVQPLVRDGIAALLGLHGEVAVAGSVAALGAGVTGPPPSSRRGSGW